MSSTQKSTFSMSSHRNGQKYLGVIIWGLTLAQYTAICLWFTVELIRFNSMWMKYTLSLWIAITFVYLRLGSSHHRLRQVAELPFTKWLTLMIYNLLLNLCCKSMELSPMVANTVMDRFVNSPLYFEWILRGSKPFRIINHA